MLNKPYLTSNEVASLLRVSPVTIRQWAQKGMISAEFTPGGHRRFMVDEIKRFASKHHISLSGDNSAGDTSTGDVPDGDLRVLIVDDDEHISRYLAELLTRIGKAHGVDLRARVANDGFDAGTKVFRFQPHAVLLDLLMPAMDGFEVCHNLKEDPVTSAIRIIAMTAFPTDENIERITAAGAEKCLSKPIDQTMLMDALELDRYVSSRVSSR